MFDEIEKKLGLKMNDLIKMMEFFKQTDFEKEQEIRVFIRRVSHATNKPISKKTENLIVQAFESFQNDRKIYKRK
ncbi:stage VI sporulation protein F [Bacillus sp. S/N-304-OC-R1]|uniref:stage VI sporulation protein F n=1 Tax=Bacillus sp. S/N-304-OC-R1 TaxID=2758034 RepID=UPI001C8DF9E9|nr:stage VI sporulation protein F [Bacillus sp. S/N-304-OC-R1]MBY0123301.1 stage VI sporulation protein F [Bacillus sp. S/N-304-OC-R1]